MVLKNEILIGILSINLFIYYITKEVIYSYDHGLIGLMLTKPIKYWIIPKRTMFTRIKPIAQKTSTNLLSSQNNFSKITLRNYAKRVIQNAENPKNVTDSLSLHNNPVTKKGRHFEAARHECKENPLCRFLDCPKLCGTPGDIKATGHMTSDPNPPVASGNKTDKVSDTNLKGENKKQYRVSYKDAHKTSNTKEHIPGTDKLKNDPGFKQKVFQNEDKK